MERTTMKQARKRYAGRVKTPAVRDADGNVLTPKRVFRHPPAGLSFRQWAAQTFRKSSVALSPKLEEIVSGRRA